MSCQKNNVFCLSSQLDIFKGPLKQLSQEGNAYVPHFPLTTLSGGPIEFDIPSSPFYTDLSDTRLYIKCKVTDSDGADLAADKKVAPVNMLLHALFSKVDVSLAGRLITASADTYSWKACLETLLNFGCDAKNSQLQAIGYYKDESDDAGKKKREELVKESSEIELFGPLHVDLFFQEKYLINGVPIRIKLTRSTPAFCLQTTDANAAYKVMIQQAVLYIRRIKINPSIELAHARAMEKSNAIYPIRHTEISVVPLGSGHRYLIKDNLFAGRIPVRLVIAMLTSNAYNGSYQTSPFVFKHMNTERIDITFEGEPIAGTPMHMDFKNALYMRAYHNMFCSLNKSFADFGHDISFTDFKKTYPLFCFDLTSDGCGNSATHFELEKRGNLRISLTFGENTSETIYVLFYAEFENVIEVTKTREILT
jgi:hypothetical protein